MRALFGQCVCRAGGEGLRWWLAATAFSCLPVTAAEVLVTQGGGRNLAAVEQVATSAQARVDQDGHGGRIFLQQAFVQRGAVDIQQHGTGNLLTAHQVHAHGSSIEATQAGSGNRSSLGQFSTGIGTSAHLLSVRQDGLFGVIEAWQHGLRATGVILQTAAATSNTAILHQAGIAPTAVIEQGVTRTHHQSFAIAAEALRARSNQVTAASSAHSTAWVMQVGGLGLMALIIQSGDGQSASISQSGAYLEAEIFQSGARHTASITQTGNGSAASPYRASVTQSGVQPHGVNVQQVSGASPRVVRVVQR